MRRRRGRVHNSCPPLIVWVFAIVTVMQMIYG